MDRFPLGLNTYCLRAMRWHDLKLLDYAAGLKLDAVFLQDSIDPGVNDPAHWKEVKDAARVSACISKPAPAPRCRARPTASTPR